MLPFVFVLGLVLTSAANADDPNPVGWWKLDEGTGTAVADSSGAGHNGAFAEGTPEWVEGMYGTALKFDGSNKVEIPDHADFQMPQEVSVALWALPEEGQPDWGKFFCKQRNGNYPYALDYDSSQQIRAYVTTSSGTFTAIPRPSNFPGEWGHLCLTYDGSALILYKDGEEVARTDASGNLQQNDLALSIGGRLNSGQNYEGIIDDVRLYNRALTQQEILGVMAGVGGEYPLASRPTPSDGALLEDTWATLSWRAGDFAVSHDVYLGDNFDDVNEGMQDSEVFRGNITDTFLAAGFPGNPYPDGLVNGTTYYWRIDEVNDAEPNSPWKGDVWSFSIPPKTAYTPIPADGAELVDLNVKLTWTAGFGAVLHYVVFGEDLDEVNNTAMGRPNGPASYDPGSLKLAKTYYWRVDEFDGSAINKGDVWSFTTEGAASGPNPENGAVDVKPSINLSWDAGTVAASHEVYFGTDADAVKNATTASPEYKGPKALGEESYDPGILTLNTTYYWRIEEVNGVNPDGPWASNVWSFTTGDFFVIDDFEDYDAVSKQIWWSWKDGLGYVAHDNEPAYPGNGTGSAVGDETTASFTEETIVHGGSQSMPFVFNNNQQGYAYYSEVEYTLPDQRDWTDGGVAELSLWFHGDPNNSAEPLYVAVSNSSGTPAVVIHDDLAAAQIVEWTQWIISLQTLTDKGIVLTNVDRIAIGLGTKGNMNTPGGEGKMYIDDIHLYQSRGAAE